jgi:hypothetical protein
MPGHLESDFEAAIADPQHDITFAESLECFEQSTYSPESKFMMRSSILHEENARKAKIEGQKEQEDVYDTQDAPVEAMNEAEEAAGSSGRTRRERPKSSWYNISYLLHLSFDIPFAC